jgi:hypothetical protein
MSFFSCNRTFSSSSTSPSCNSHFQPNRFSSQATAYPYHLSHGTSHQSICMYAKARYAGLQCPVHVHQRSTRAWTKICEPHLQMQQSLTSPPQSPHRCRWVQAPPFGPTTLSTSLHIPHMSLHTSRFQHKET